MSFRDFVEKYSRTTALFWASFFVFGAVGFMAADNLKLRRQVKALEASRGVHIVNSVRLNPLEIKAMMEEVLAKTARPAAAAPVAAPKAAKQLSIADFCATNEETALRQAKALNMRVSRLKSHYSPALDRCFMDMTADYTDTRSREWVIRVVYDAGNDKTYGEMNRRPGAQYTDFCAVYPGGDKAAAVKCFTEADFERGIAPYMEK
jgi:hypothetical protein